MEGARPQHQPSRDFPCVNFSSDVAFTPAVKRIQAEKGSRSSYARSRRIKLWGSARVVEGDLVLLDKLRDSTYSGKVERAILFEIEAWDVNCPEHIHKRFPQQQVATVIEQLQARIAELEGQVKVLESNARGG